jgi:uncharacterized OB-fold protein
MGPSADPGHSVPARPVPDPAEYDTAPLWAGTREHELRYQTCRACGTVVWYPRAHCTGCGRPDLRWQSSAGLGTVYTFTVVRQHPHPFFRGRLPYVTALVDLDEGFRVLTEITAADPESVRVGQRVRLVWEDHEELSVPLFAPAEATSGILNPPPGGQSIPHDGQAAPAHG